MKHFFLIILILGATATIASAGKLEYNFKREDVEGMGPVMQREIAGMQYLLNAYQIRQFIQLPNDTERREWVNRYWLSRDPTPDTPRNEMMVEHYIRAKLARQFFKRKEWPGWDKRGEIFIRYGAPGVRARIPAEVTVRKTHAPGELWHYPEHTMVVVFRDESLTGNYIYAINAFGATQDMNPDLAEYLIYDTDRSLQRIIPADFIEFYRDPETDPDAVADWSPMHDALLGPQQEKVIRPRMRGVSERWDEPTNPDLGRATPNNPSTQFIMRQAEELANNFDAVLEDVPSSYPFNFEGEQFPFYFGVEQFKGGDKINRIEVNIEFPVEPVMEDETNPAARQYVVTAVFRDARYNEISRQKREIITPVYDDTDPSLLMPAQIVFSLPEDYYRVSITVAETRQSADSLAVRKSSYRHNVTFKDFVSDLAISDILFAQKIAAIDKQSPFMRGTLEVVPHPIRRYKQGTGIPLYFEIYNLTIDDEGLSTYEVEYRIIPHSARKQRFWDRFDDVEPVVSSQFRSSGFSADEPLYVTVKAENLDPGTYDFLITIKDVNSQSVAYRRSTFRIVK